MASASMSSFPFAFASSRPAVIPTMIDPTCGSVLKKAGVCNSIVFFAVLLLYHITLLPMEALHTDNQMSAYVPERNMLSFHKPVTE